MVNYVLVHGGNMSVETWNRLTVGNHICTQDGKMGGKIWEPVIPALEESNHRTFSPDLKDEYKYNLTDHVEQICTLIAENDLRKVVLVGHSYGGMIITGVAAKMADRINHLVFVDAALPEPGQSLFDIIVAGGYDPLSFAGLEAVPPYLEKLQFCSEKLISLPKTYIRCMESEFVIISDEARKRIAATGKGWGDYFELPTGHVPMASMPERLVQILLETGKKK
ncbi:MAG: alpha/beta fold hydrolase [Negativicutes bacterium]|jgi:pimeloyl-ACP methyl ester carboxylesterase